MRAARVFLGIAIALALQTTLARFFTGPAIVDLVLVVVIYAALMGGPGAGLMAGAVGGLAQDALSSTGVSLVAAGFGVATAKSIIGIGGLAKTVVGFVAGVVGTQFIVARPFTRFVVFFLATIAHGIMFLGLYAILDPRDGSPAYGGVVSQAAGNAVVGVVILQMVEVFPGFLDRRRSTRGRMRINRRLD